MNERRAFMCVGPSTALPLQIGAGMPNGGTTSASQGRIYISASEKGGAVRIVNRAPFVCGVRPGIRHLVDERDELEHQIDGAHVVACRGVATRQVAGVVGDGEDDQR